MVVYAFPPLSLRRGWDTAGAHGGTASGDANDTPTPTPGTPVPGPGLAWPGQVPVRKSNEMVAIHDFLPTFAALLDDTLPAERPIDGRNQLPFFLGESESSARGAKANHRPYAMKTNKKTHAIAV